MRLLWVVIICVAFSGGVVLPEFYPLVDVSRSRASALKMVRAVHNVTTVDWRGIERCLEDAPVRRSPFESKYSSENSVAYVYMWPPKVHRSIFVCRSFFKADTYSRALVLVHLSLIHI